MTFNRSCSSQPLTVTISASDGEVPSLSHFCDGQHIGSVASLDSVHRRASVGREGEQAIKRTQAAKII
jgi:hypothetical protein